MHDMASALLVFVRALLVRALLVGSLYGFRLDTARAVQQFLRVQAETLNQYMKKGRARVYDLAALGKLDTAKDGRRLLIRRASIDTYLNGK